MTVRSAVKKPVLRKCIGCMDLKEKKDLVRLYINDEGTIIADKTFKSGGRGAYICKNEACFQKAIKRKALDHSFKMRIPKEEYERILIEIIFHKPVSESGKDE